MWAELKIKNKNQKNGPIGRADPSACDGPGAGLFASPARPWAIPKTGRVGLGPHGPGFSWSGLGLGGSAYGPVDRKIQ